MAYIIAQLLLCIDHSVVVQAWTVGAGGAQQQAAAMRRTSSSVNYAPPCTPTTETPELVAQKILRQTASTAARQVPEKQQQGACLSFSPSAAACDSQRPLLHTSNGLLSPGTVLRMEELIIREGHQSEALVSFLKTYKRHGPMSCLPMLSDPHILPHLTNAMRESMAY